MQYLEVLTNLMMIDLGSVSKVLRLIFGNNSLKYLPIQLILVQTYQLGHF